MEKLELVERAKMYMKLLCDGVHPVTGEEIPTDSALADGKVKRCFAFISEVLDEYAELTERVERLEREKDKQVVVLQKKQQFTISREQCESIRLSREPLSVLAFMKNINSVIDSDTTEKLSSTRINKWLTDKGLVITDKVPTLVSKTVYKPSEFASRIGIVEEEVVDKKSREVKSQIKLSERAQLFIIENLEDIVANT